MSSVHARDSKLVHSVHGAVYMFPLAVISTLVTNMSTAIIRHFDAARAAISAERNCRAQGAAKLNARFAAVSAWHEGDEILFLVLT